MSKCRVCLNESYQGLIDLLFNPPICAQCLNGFEDIVKVEYIDGIEHLFLYKYNSFLRELIYLYKGRYNKALSAVLIYKYKLYLKYKYRKYTFLCVPSNRDDDRKRGFNHVEEIAKEISTKVICPFYKKKRWKQSDMKSNDRDKISEVIGIDQNMIKGLKRIVIIDDIYSTGNTIKSCIRHINSKCDIKVLCICRNMLK